ncbi:MAG: hypothetical protein M0Z48_10855 [Nitrospiraceae bacterium]|nr:hypothetical protein [Nitrospiraceae bacterium]
MADIIKLIKKQSQRSIAELRELSGKLAEQLKHVISLIPEDTRQKSVEDFLNGIRESVLGQAPRKYKRRAKRASASAPKRPRKTKAGKGAGRRGRKKKAATPAAEEQKQA